MRALLAALTLLAAATPIVTSAAPAAKKPKPARTSINVTGKWSANFSGGMDLLLHQEGNLVWGKDNGGYLIRGDWQGGLLTIFYRLDFKGEATASCSAPRVAILWSKGTATRMSGIEFTPSGETQDKALTRDSANPGPDFSYPYASELEVCGSLPAHDLIFDSGSDKLTGSDWPLLAAVAELLAKEATFKIEISGHTDASGDAAKNKELSQRRAESVKAVLVGKYKADAGRIKTRGWGSEQALATNDTDEGRSVNRRVEILAAR